MRALLLVIVLASAAHAEKPHVIAVEDELPARWHRLGTRFMYGSIPIDGVKMTTMAPAITLDVPLTDELRLLGEYEYLWIGPRAIEEQAMVGLASLADNGHRVHTGLRWRFYDKQWEGDRVENFGVFVDADLGGGAMLVEHRPRGTIAVPHAYVGARVGFFLADTAAPAIGGSPITVEKKQLWEYELFVRVLALSDGPGVMFGLGLVWGQ